MKPGAGDDPFAEEASEESETGQSEDDPSETSPNRAAAMTADEATTTPQTATTDSQSQLLPYKYRRESVKDGRSQRPIFVQSETEDLIEDMIARAERRFDETVYKTDVVEAMLVAAAEETTPEAVLQRWGYGMR